MPSINQLIQNVYTYTIAASFAVYFYIKLRRGLKNHWIKRKYHKLMENESCNKNKAEENHTLAYAHYCNTKHAWGSENEVKWPTTI